MSPFYSLAGGWLAPPATLGPERSDSLKVRFERS